MNLFEANLAVNRWLQVDGWVNVFQTLLADCYVLFRHEFTFDLPVLGLTVHGVLLVQVSAGNGLLCHCLHMNCMWLQ